MANHLQAVILKLKLNNISEIKEILRCYCTWSQIKSDGPVWTAISIERPSRVPFQYMTRFNHQPATNHCLNRHSYLSLHLSDLWCRIPWCGYEIRSAARDPTVSPEGEWTVQLQLGLQTYMCPRHQSGMVSYHSLQSLGPPMPDLAFPWA